MACAPAGPGQTHGPAGAGRPRRGADSARARPCPGPPPASPGPVRGRRRTPGRGSEPAPADALEALVEAALGAVLVLADEPPHAHRQADDQGAYDVDDVAPARAIGRDRRSFTARAQGGGELAGHVHDRPLARLVDGPEHAYVVAAQAQRDTVGHGVWLLFGSAKPKSGSQARFHHGPSARQPTNFQPPFAKTQIRKNKHTSLGSTSIQGCSSGFLSAHPSRSIRRHPAIGRTARAPRQPKPAGRRTL